MMFLLGFVCGFFFLLAITLAIHSGRESDRYECQLLDGKGRPMPG